MKDNNEYNPVLKNNLDNFVYKLITKSNKETESGLQDLSIQILLNTGCFIVSLICAFIISSDILGYLTIIFFITSFLGYFLKEKFIIQFKPTNINHKNKYKIWTPIYYFSEYTFAAPLIYMFFLISLIPVISTISSLKYFIQ